MLKVKTNHKDSEREFLVDLWDVAIAAVNGRNSVNSYFENNGQLLSDEPYSVIAVGKAANDMMLGAVDILGDKLASGLVISKHDHITRELIENSKLITFESSHPVPDESSIKAGRMLIDFIGSIPKGAKVLALISGGASSLVEVLQDTYTLQDLQELTEWGLANGLNIHEMNYLRQGISKVKNGKLCEYFDDQDVTCLYISDVPDDDMNIIGSGLLYRSPQGSERHPADNSDLSLKIEQSEVLPKALQNIDSFKYDGSDQVEARFSHNIVASNQIAKQAIADHVGKQNRSVYASEGQYDDDYRVVADQIIQTIKSQDFDVFVWGGETTVELPENPGLGGRNQALALYLAINLSGVPNVFILSVGTDGTDGPTDAAGGFISSYTYQHAKDIGLVPEEFLKSANAYELLKQTNELFSPGPTGTNVMDIVIALKAR